MVKAFFDFFTVWLWIPTIFSIMITIYQHLLFLNTSWSIGYMLLVTVWATFVSEMWKRKENQIAFLWGFILTTIHTVKSDQLNPYFIGTAQCDINTGEMVHVKDKLYSRFGKFFNFLLSGALIFGNVYCYFNIKESSQCWLNESEYIKTHPRKSLIEAAGTSLLIVLSTGLFNALYVKILMRLIIKENHKHKYKVEESLTNKLMLFKLVNANLSVVFTCAELIRKMQIAKNSKQADVVDAYGTIYELLLTIFMGKMLSTYFIRYLVRYIKVCLAKKNYFKIIRKKSKEQKETYLANQAYSKLVDKVKLEKRNEYSLKEELFEMNNTEDQIPVYERLIFSNNLGKHCDDCEIVKGDDE